MREAPDLRIRTNESKVFPHPAPALRSSDDREEDFMTIEMIAGKLHETIEWVESQCRRRSPKPIPFHNVGNHRLFLWSEVHAWVMNSPKVIHSRHRRRTKDEIAAVQKVKQNKAA
jgi:hypothetical protein